MKKEKICSICKLKINEKEERWVLMRDMFKGEIITENYYHLKCWHEGYDKKKMAMQVKMFAQAIPYLTEKVKETMEIQ